MDKEIYEYKTIKKPYECTWVTNRKHDMDNCILSDKETILHDFSQDYSRINVKHIDGMICPVLRGEKILELDSAIPDIGEICSFSRIILPTPFEWVRKIYLYVTTSFINTVSVLFEEDDKKYNILYDGKLIPPYELNGSHLNYMSIVVSSNIENENKYSISNAIDREMIRGYELIRNKYIEDESNRDIKYFYITLPKSDITYETKYYNYTDEQIKTFISSLNAEEIYALIRDMVYYLNTSEMKSIILKPPTIIDLFGKEVYDPYAEVFNTSIYIGLKKILTGLLDYTNNNIKHEFSVKYMYQFSMIYSEDYQIFTHNDTFNKDSFVLLINFLKERIDKVISECECIFKSQHVVYAKTKNYIRKWKRNILNMKVKI